MKFPNYNRNESIFKEINDFSFDEDSSDKFISNILYEKDIKNENIQIDNSQEEKDNKKEKEEEENKLLSIQGKIYDTDKKKNYVEENKFCQKKRGRKPIKLDKKYKEIHDKNKDDNLLRKIQVHYITFIIAFINNVLKKLNYKEKFISLNYKFKSNVKADFVDKLKKETLGDIICEKKSPKFQKYNENKNLELYKKFSENEVLKNIFLENYIDFFRKIYYKSKRTINLKEYGINEVIDLSPNIKMYKDLLNEKDVEYKKRLNECIYRYFLPEAIFMTI